VGGFDNPAGDGNVGFKVFFAGINHNG
jgi:hypothetical protein